MFKSAIFDSPYFSQREGVAAELKVARNRPAFSELFFAAALFVLVSAVTGASLIPANLWQCSGNRRRSGAAAGVAATILS